ncbi:Uncharacterized protein FWK35_00024639 [Aphis craccivora]|uniref:Uncharacterized protein n=1 Tax=Aphis craccivora TaxID=307492 RepID=A0A6G0YID1_APHCR|nr:Uncharacterized protein FWK35_00024639 [Aphis craccivora]
MYNYRNLINMQIINSERSDVVNKVGKLNVVVTLGGQNVRKNPKKVTEKREFLRKTSFRPNRFFYMAVNQELITVNS